MAEAKIEKQCLEHYYDSVEVRLCILTAAEGHARREEILECKEMCQTLACKRHCDFMATGYDANVFMPDFYGALKWEACGKELIQECDEIEGSSEFNKNAFMYSCLANATKTSAEQLKRADNCTMGCKHKPTIYSYSACFGNCTKDLRNSLEMVPDYHAFKTDPNSSIFHPPVGISGSLPLVPLFSILLAALYVTK